MSSGLTYIQITDHEVRALAGQWPSPPVIFRKERGPDSDLKTVLKAVLLKLPKGMKQCALIIPRHDTVLKEMEFPSTDPKEISRMVSLQIPMVIPYDDTQVLYQHHLVKTEKSGYSKVLSGIVLNNVIQKYADALSLDSCDIKDIYLSFDALGEFISKYFASEHQLCNAFIFMNEQSTELMFYRSEPVLSYYIPYGRHDIADNIGGFVQEVKRCIQDFESSHSGFSVNNIFYDIKEIEAPVFKDFLSLGHDVEVKNVNFFCNMPDQVRAFAEKEKLDSSWAVLMGCFCAADHKKFMSFLPKGIHSSKIRKRNKKVFIGLFCSMLAVLLTGTSLVKIHFHKHERYLRSLQKQVKLLEPRLDQLHRKNEFILLMSEKSAASSVVDMVKAVYQTFPEDVFLLYLAMKQNGQFELQGTAQSDQNLGKLQSALVSSDFFKKVDLQYATKRKRFNNEYTEFKITFEPAR